MGVRVVPHAGGGDDAGDDATASQRSPGAAHDPASHPSTSGGAGPAPGTEYLTFMVHRLLEFRRPELEALAQVAGCSDSQLRWRAPAGDVELSPFWYLRLPGEAAAARIAERMMLTKMIVELWGEGADWAELRAAVEAYPQERKAPWLAAGRSFRVLVESFGSSASMEQQLAAVEALEFVGFEGTVRLRNPEITFVLLTCDCGDHGSLIDAPVPRRLYFGRVVGAAQRGLADRYSLRRRPYIGPTSLDAELAFVVANAAKVARGQLVLDPYAGTGSMLVAAAHMGAHVVGADIDMRVIRDGKVGPSGARVDIRTNFAHYGLRPPADLLRMDAHVHALRPGLEEVFHAIIGDPPYGVRAGAKKSGARPGEALRPITDRATHIPATQPYTLGEALRDLLDLAARLLVVGGRLAYFLPATPATYDEADVPAHPALQLVANCEQFLTGRYSRRLVVMQKAAPYDAAAAAAHHAARPDPALPIDRLHDIVYEQLPRCDGASTNGGAAAGGDGGAAAPTRRRCRGKVC